MDPFPIVPPKFNRRQRLPCSLLILRITKARCEMGCLFEFGIIQYIFRTRTIQFLFVMILYPKEETYRHQQTNNRDACEEN